MILVAAAALAGGCTVETATGSGSSTTTPEPPPPPPDDTGATAGTDGAGGTGGADPNAGSGTAPSEACPNPNDHCLPDGIFFASKQEWKHGYVYVDAAAQQTPPDGAGVAKFMSRRDGSEIITKWFYKTRPAQRNELAVGKMVIMFHHSRDHIYLPPETRTDALGKKWWMSRIVSVAPLATGNYVLVASGYKISADNLRYIEGDSSPAITVNGTEDAHFLKDDHWLVSERPLKDRGYQYVDIGAPIQAPSAQTKNEGHFLFLRSGKTLWTAHAWKTRPATQDDMKLGARVFMFHANSRDKVYRKPADRASALTKKWWTAKVTDNSTAYKGTVTVDGKYQVAIDAIRVPVN